MTGRRFPRLSLVVLGTLLVGAMAFALRSPFARGPYATTGFVKNIGTAASETPGTFIAITVPAGGVAASNSILLTFAIDESVGAVGAADSQGNLYTVDADVSNSGTVRTVIFSAHVVTPLVSGDFITVTHPLDPLRSARALSANEFSGLVTPGTLDQTSTATGNSASPSSGSTALTTQAEELLIGAIGEIGRASCRERV